ncbi:MAG: response regulator [Polyangiales bacterium]
MLLVDEDPTMVAYLESILEDTLVSIETASIIEDAVSLCAKVKPRAVLVGLPFAEFQTQELVSTLRDAAGSVPLSIVAVSLDESEQARLEAVEADVDVFISHPVDPADLVEAIRRAVTTPRASEIRVLVVGSESSAHRLATSGFEVDTVEDADRLVDVIEARQPDVLLCGQSFDDLSALRALRKLAWKSDFALLSEHAFAASDAIDAGIDDLCESDETLAQKVYLHGARIARSRTVFPVAIDGLVPRDAAIHLIEAELSAARRHRRPFTVALVAIDGMGSVHFSKRSSLFRRVARLVSGKFRREDVRGIWSENHLVLGFESSDSAQMQEVVNRMTASIYELGAEAEGLRLRARMASFPTDGDSVRKLLEKAIDRLS